MRSNHGDQSAACGVFSAPKTYREAAALATRHTMGPDRSRAERTPAEGSKGDAGIVKLWGIMLSPWCQDTFPKVASNLSFT